MTPIRAAMPVRWALVLAALVCSTPQGAALAQGTGRSMDIDTSIRAAGMGGAGVAVWWGEPGVWGNPASLSTVQGIGWLDGRTKLVPDLDADIRLDSQRLLLGGGGLGVALTGAPVDGLGKLRLDYGVSEGTDPFGNPTGTFDSFEQVDAWGIGVSPLRVLDAVRQVRRGGEPPAERPFDVAFGFQRKRTQIALAPIALVGVAQATCDDWGASARWSLLPDRSPSAPAHLEISGGFAMLNANDAQFVFANEDVAVPPSRIRRMGFAVHSALPSPWTGGVDTPVRLLVAEVHLLELGFAFDTEHVTAGHEVPPFGAPPYDVTRFGIEATLFGVLTGRLGHFHDPSTGVDDVTHGFGVRLPIGPWASVAYDRAFVPQPLGLADRDRKGWSAWVDPLRILADLR